MIHFSGTVTPVLKGFSEQIFKLQTDSVKKYRIQKVALQNVFCDYGSYE